MQLILKQTYMAAHMQHCLKTSCNDFRRELYLPSSREAEAEAAAGAQAAAEEKTEAEAEEINCKE